MPDNQHDIPPPTSFAKKAFRLQRRNAGRRGIAFHLDFATWWQFWNAVPGRWERRGRGLERLCMARFADVGPYALHNIYCATNARNIADTDPARISAATLAARDAGRMPPAWLGKRGPSAKPVITPAGWYPSAREAARAFGIPESTASARARLGRKGWRYETP